jgi:serine/threonine protein kinase
MYILFSGNFPFYSDNENSPSLVRRIKKGVFTFPDEEWANVSSEAKELIEGMLQPNPEKRISIEKIINNNWISVYIKYIFLLKQKQINLMYNIFY